MTYFSKNKTSTSFPPSSSPPTIYIKFSRWTTSPLNIRQFLNKVTRSAHGAARNFVKSPNHQSSHPAAWDGSGCRSGGIPSKTAKARSRDLHFSRSLRASDLPPPATPSFPSVSSFAPRVLPLARPLLIHQACAQLTLLLLSRQFAKLQRVVAPVTRRNGP